MNPADEISVDEDADIFTSLVESYGVDQVDNEGDASSSEDEVENVPTAVALQCLEQIKLWKLQKGDIHELQALHRIGREMMLFKGSAVTQTSIHSFFKLRD